MNRAERRARKKQPTSPRMVRCAPDPDPIGLAIHCATKLKTHDADTVINLLHKAFDAMRQGTATLLQYSILNGCLDVARFIERGGVVTGLSDQIASASTAMGAIFSRSKDAQGHWKQSALHWHELLALDEFLIVHAFQIRQLSRAEYVSAIRSAKGFIGRGAVMVNADEVVM